MNDWKPIETAPKDGTKILAFGKEVEGRPVMAWDDSKPRIEGMCVIRWHEGWYEEDIPVGDGLFKKERKLAYSYWMPDPQQFRPTHWQSLPEPPK